MQRQRFGLFLLVVMVLGLALPGYAQEDEVVELSLSCTCSDALATDITEFVIPNFVQQKADEGVEVVVELIDYDLPDEQYKEQLALDFSLGEGSDIVGFDGFWTPEFVSAGLLKPLDEVAGATVNEWEGWEHIPPGVQAALEFQGERYGIPQGTNVRLMFYRADLFEQAGIATPWQPANWEDILTTARQLKEAGIEIPFQLNAGTIMGEATTLQGYFMVLLGAGTHMYDFDQNKWIVSDPGIVEALEFYQTVYNEGLGNAELQLTEDARNLTFEAFQQGEIGIYLESDFLWRTVTNPNNEDFGIENRDEVVQWAMMPASEPGAGYRGQDVVTISGGAGWALNPNTQHPELAWELLAYLSSQEVAIYRQQSEPRISFRDDVEITNDPQLSAMADALLPFTTGRPLLPEYPLVSYEAQLMTERVITGEMTPAEAMAAYDEAVTAIVGEENVMRVE